MSDFMKLIPIDPIVEMQLKRSEKNEIIFRHGHIAITNYMMGDNREFEKSLSVYDKFNFKYNMVGGHYIPEMREFRINRGYDVNFLRRFFPNHTPTVDNKAYKSDKVEAELYTEPKNDFQKVALAFMSGYGKYEKNLRFTQQMIDAESGGGKTFCGVATSILLSARVVIFVPISKLVDQWKESYLQFTSVTEDEIMVVKGSKKCEEIRKGEHKDKRVFIFITDTFLAYHRLKGNMKTIDMLSKTRAYMKIVDEVHKDLKIISILEALSNFRMNYYMSASPGRSDRKEDFIFKKLYCNIPHFGANFRTKEERHINMMVKKYTFLPNSLQIKEMYRPNIGLNGRVYERVLMSAPERQRRSFDESVSIMFQFSAKMIDKKNKVLVLCYTTDGTEYLKNLAEKSFPGECSVYHGKLNKREKEAALDARVIIATEGSMGTGADVKGIQHVYNICSYSNKIGATQYPGRGRKIDDDTPIVYIELVNFGYQQTTKQFFTREPYLKKTARKGRIEMIN